jgi:hypothetical protein
VALDAVRGDEATVVVNLGPPVQQLENAPACSCTSNVSATRLPLSTNERTDGLHELRKDRDERAGKQYKTIFGYNMAELTGPNLNAKTDCRANNM